MWHFFSTSKIVYVTLIFNFNEHLRPELQVIKYGQMAIRGKSLLYPSNSWLGTKMCELIVKMCVFVIAMLLCKYCWQKDSSDPDFSCGRDERMNGRTDQPKVVQEVLADLKRERKKWVTFAYGPQPPLTVSLTVKYLFFTTSLSDLVNFPRKLCLKLSWEQGEAPSFEDQLGVQS